MTTLKISGMSCQNCVGSVKKAIEAIEDTGEVTVNLETGTAAWTGSADMETVKKAVTAIGFGVE